MGTIKLIAGFISRLLAAGMTEMKRRRRRAQNFRALSQRRTTQPFFVSKRLRVARMPGRL
jgi:hypothetical protein